MSDVIQCPTCAKKYRLPASPPPTFTCKSCGTVMDLSGFAAAAPEPPAALPATGRAGRRGRASAGSAGGRGRARGGRRGQPADDYEEEGTRRYSPRASGPSPAVLWGSIAGLVLAVVVLLLVLSGKKDDGAQDGDGTTTAGSSGGSNPAGTGTGTQPPGSTGGAGATGTPPAGGGTEPAGGGTQPAGGGTQPAGGGTQPAREERLPVPEGKTYYPYSRAEIREHPWRADVTGEEQNQIEQAVEAAVEIGGRDGNEAEDYLVSMDIKAAGRLVSEFKRILDKYGTDDPEALARMMVVDRILRKIDGIMERHFGLEDDLIKPVSSGKHATNVAKRWNWWWDLERWQKRFEPWDPSEAKDPENPDGGGDDEER